MSLLFFVGFILWFSMGVTYFLIWLIHLKGTFHMTSMSEVEQFEKYSKKIAKKWTVLFLALNTILFLFAIFN